MAARSSLTRIDISSGTIFRVVLILLGFWLLYVAFDIVLMLYAAFIVASVVEPAANYLERYKVPRALTVVMVYVLILLVLSGVIALMVEPLAHQTRQLAEAVPRIVAVIGEVVPVMPEIDQESVVRTIQSGLIRFGNNLANISLNVFAGTRSVISGFVAFLFVFVIALYLVVERNAVKKFARLIVTQEHYPYVEKSIEKIQKGIGRWVLAQSIMGLIIGVLVGIGLWIIGVPYALLLGILAGVMELVPAIGPIMAATPGVLVGFSEGLTVGLVTFGMYVAIGQFENHILIPNIMRKAVGLRPIVTIIAVILGARLLGLLGVILAVPTAMALSIFLSDVFKSK